MEHESRRLGAHDFAEGVHALDRRLAGVFRGHDRRSNLLDAHDRRRVTATTNVRELDHRKYDVLNLVYYLNQSDYICFTDP